jgi:hypothetical protein
MAARQITQVQPSDANADKPFHFIPYVVKHPANLAIDALSQNDSQSDQLDWMDSVQPRALTVEHDSLEKFRRESGIPGTIESDLVLLLDFVTGMGQALREVAVVGQEEKALGLGIEPADVKEARQMRREQVEDGVPGLRI